MSSLPRFQILGRGYIVTPNVRFNISFNPYFFWIAIAAFGGGFEAIRNPGVQNIVWRDMSRSCLNPGLPGLQHNGYV